MENNESYDYTHDLIQECLPTKINKYEDKKK